ncbi:hypothetical protein ACFXAF_12255 [Kitasatospora sp. NPDC059463]|uniref:hypothetical protein n=1 Tax=unclassified Kitasatospora TaxID=2633591 RepID=UPI0036AF910A
MGILRRSTPPPPPRDAQTRAAEAAAHAEMARYAFEDGSDGNEERHRLGKAVRAAKGLRNKARDDPNELL